jgi:hypothetical protein
MVFPACPDRVVILGSSDLLVCRPARPHTERHRLMVEAQAGRRVDLIGRNHTCSRNGVDRVVSAIRLAAQARGDTAVADALAAAVAKQQGRERAMARQREQKETEAARREEEEAVVSGLRHELQALRTTDPGMSLLDAVEYIASDPDRRIALYRLCSAEDGDSNASCLDQDAPHLLKIASSSATDLAFLERRAEAEGFQG